MLRLRPMRCRTKAVDLPKRLQREMEVIDGSFVTYLRQRHTSEFTIRLYRRFLRKVARYLSKRKRSASLLRLRDVPAIMRGCLLGWKAASRKPHQAGLRQWLRFIGRFQAPSRAVRWQEWLDNYDRFLSFDRALADCTRASAIRVISRYLEWQFRGRRLRWASVQTSDLHRYALRLNRVFTPKTVNDYLSTLRQFFRYLHMQGEGTPALALAVPTVADFGHRRLPELLDDGRRRKFLSAFDRKSDQGRRDYTIAVCLIDLGLRAIEVSRLRIPDIDDGVVTVPPAKSSAGRQLPLPAHAASAIRDYLRHRPSTGVEQVFVGQTVLRGRPLSTAAIAAAMDRAYRRCGFTGYFGTHRLRHSFATRLYAHGATTKEIADVLGHRRVATTDRYTQTDDLRSLAQSWPM